MRARSVLCEILLSLASGSAEASCDVLLGFAEAPLSLEEEVLLFLLFFLTPASLAPPLSLRPPGMVLV